MVFLTLRYWLWLALLLGAIGVAHASVTDGAVPFPAPEQPSPAVPMNVACAIALNEANLLLQERRDLGLAEFEPLWTNAQNSAGDQKDSLVFAQDQWPTMLATVSGPKLNAAFVKLCHAESALGEFLKQHRNFVLRIIKDDSKNEMIDLIPTPSPDLTFVREAGPGSKEIFYLRRSSTLASWSFICGTQ